jgi:hypothetical protein
MKKTLLIIVTVLLIAGWSLAASALHVIWTGSSVIVIPKNRLGVRDTYVNVTGWTADDVSNHPKVTSRLIATGKAAALSHVFQTTGEDLVTQLQEAITRGPTTQPAPTIIDQAKQVATQASQVVQH